MISVDAIAHYPMCQLPYKDWCHMATDSDLEELHQMAARLGLRRVWFQNTPTHPHYDLTPGKRAASHPTWRPGGEYSRTLTTLLPAHPGQRGAATHDGGSAMTALKRNEKRSVPDGVQMVMQPYKPMQQTPRSHVLHLPSRRNASRTGIVPIDSRCSPSFSQVPPAFPRRIPSCGQAHMLQLSLNPGDGVHVHLVLWAYVEAAAQQADRHETAKEVLTWSEAV
jgi:hypothetical protein